MYDQNEFGPVLPQEAIDMYRKGIHLTGRMIDSMFSAIQKGIKVSGRPISRFAAWIHFETRISYTRRSCGKSTASKTKLDVYPPNSYWLLFPALKSANKLRDHMVAGMDWLLERTPNLRSADTDAKLPVF